MPLSPSSSGHCVMVCFLKVSLQLPDRKKTWTDVFGSELDDVLFVVQKDLAVKKKKTFEKDPSGFRHTPQPLVHLKLKKGKVSQTPSLAG